jgi:hypothetical protein
MMFFAFYRGDFPAENYFIRSKPFESIYFLIYNSTVTSIEMYKNIFGNIILFMPYGFLGILYSKLNLYKSLFLVFIVVINVLEFSQYYFGRGYAELDDVILNTFGMTIGYIIYKKWFFTKDK